MDDLIFMIIASYIINFPILLSWNYALDRSLVIVHGKNFSLKQFAEVVSLKPIVVDSTTRLTLMRRLLKPANSQGVFFPVDFRVFKSQNKQEKIDFLNDIAHTNTLDGRPWFGVPAYICQNVIPKDLRDYVYAIFLENDLPILDPLNIIPESRNLPMIKDKLESTTGTQAISGMLAAAYFLYPYARTNGIDFSLIIETAHRMDALDEEFREGDDISSLFLDQLYEWQEKNSFCEIYYLPNLSMEQMVLLKRAIFVDARKGELFLSDELFNEIVHPLFQFFPLPVIKERLCDSGIMKRGEKKRFSSHMTYINITGMTSRIRMLKFDINSLNKPAKMAFIDKCLLSKNTKGGRK